MKYTESDLETATLEWFEEVGYQVIGGPDIDPQSDNPERKTFGDVILNDRLHAAITKINPNIPPEAREEAFKKIKNAGHLTSHLISNNKSFHEYLRSGVDVEYRRTDGSIAGDKVWLLDTENVENNDFLAVNQFTVVENKDRRPDLIIFVNGLPIALFELKNMADENVGIRDAFHQILTYKNDIPSVFTYNQLVVISDGGDARVGTITSDMDRFMRWKTVDGDELASSLIPRLEVLIRGTFDKKSLIDLITNFIVFETDKENVYKKVAAYHQYHATNKAITKTLEASKLDGDRRAGVVWHTQGSGKSLTMVFYAGKLVKALDNPTVVIITDRNDLDDQLFSTFGNCKDLLRQTPKQAKDRKGLQELLKVASGGIVFTTVQKFSSEENAGSKLLSDRRNIIVIADEAHRSQYDFIDGFARNMHDALPNASFIGFTGTPIEAADRNTRAVFGNYVDTYDIAQAVEDEATVPIYYEARLAKIELLESEKPTIDSNFEELTEGEEMDVKERLKSKWARLEAMIGSEKRIHLVARDIVDHFENRQAVMDGKGMIVVMSRRIATDLYDEIIKLRPGWHSDDEKKGFLKVVMTGSASDPQNFQPHIRNKQGREAMANRMRDAKDELKLAIVRDMWLTGFDVPSMHTMYVDKPMKGHGLMQAIARVNRKYKDKQGGLIVDYLGLAPQLKEALSEYTETDRSETAIPQEQAVSIMLEKYEIVKGILHGYDYMEYFTAKASRRTQIIIELMNFILEQEDGKKRYRKAVTELSQAFSLSVPNLRAIQVRDEVGLFQEIKAVISKELTDENEMSIEDYDAAINQIVSNAVSSNEVVDIFKAAGLDHPDVSILSDEFLEEIKGLKYKSVALEILKKLLDDKIRSISRRNVIKARSFADLLEKTIKKYQNKTVEAAQIIAELIDLAKEIRGEAARGDAKGLSDDELAFYDALAENKSAVTELGDDTLKTISKELVKMLRKNTTIDWTLKDNVRARIRVYVKRLLREYKYPPDKQEVATQLVLEQAETLCDDWTGTAK